MRLGVLGGRLRRDRFFQLGLVLVGTVALAALRAPWVAPRDPIAGDLRNAYLLGPGGRYPLGTDPQGRDVRSRVLYGARLSLPSWGAMAADALGKAYDPRLRNER